VSHVTFRTIPEEGRWFRFLSYTVFLLMLLRPGVSTRAQEVRLDHALVLTEFPLRREIPPTPSHAWTFPSNYQPGGRLVMVSPDASVQVLTEGFYSACDPALSFDGKHLLFAGKRQVADAWTIFEMNLSDFKVRQVTQGLGDCRMPGYQSTFYTIVSPKPWYQLTFVRTEPDLINEIGHGSVTRIYSCKLDGSGVRGLTFNLSSDTTPTVLPDGRIVYAGWQRSDERFGPLGRMGLFHVNSDGTDMAAYAILHGEPFKRMPCVTTGGEVVFIESKTLAPWDGAGRVGKVRRRRPLHSYQAVTAPEAGLFHSPSPLPEGRILISRRLAAPGEPHKVCVMDPATGDASVVFEAAGYHCIQALALYPRQEPDGRSSVVTEEDPHGKLYCLNVYTNDLANPTWMTPGSVKRLRVLEGIPLRASTSGTSDGAMAVRHGGPQRAQRRMLGETAIGTDGSFNIEVPANLPVELQILDEHGMALRSCSWIWAKNHEPRGCIGCHEDGELTPENNFVEALHKPSVSLTLAPHQRRHIDFSRDVMPILSAKCASCHGANHRKLVLTDEAEGAFNTAYGQLVDADRRYVHPGRARTSPLIWSLFGRKTTRPWDEPAPSQTVVAMPPARAPALTEGERRTFVEWIDMGALWNGRPTSPAN